MKKVINSLFVIIAAMVTFAGCAKQEIDAPATSETKTVQFFANSIETKTEFGTPTDGVYPTLWSAGDMVDVSVNFAQKKTSSEVECSDDFKSARFKVDLSSAEVSAPYTFYSVSPVDRLRGISSQYKRFYVEILSAQTPLATSVDKDAQLLFAKSSTTEEMPSSVELTYHHLTAYGKFSLTNLAAESVSSIILEAEFDIAGKWDYFLEDGSFVVRSNNGSKSITLTTSSTTDIWFACAPVDMTGQKMTLTVTTEKGNFVKVLNFPADKERKFEAGKISKFTVDMAGIEVEGSEEPEQPGDSEGTTTATLSSDEIKTKIAASKCSYGNEVTYNDADDGVIWTSTCLTDVAARPWLQMKDDASVYIAISADTDIKEVVVTVTAAQNTSGGVADITKHSSFAGTLSLNTKKDGKGEDVASGTANNNLVTLTPAGNNKTLYLKTSAGARVWNIDVKKSAGSGETPEPEQPKTLVSIAVSGQTTSYTVGDTFAFDGTVTATYSDGSTAEVEPTSVSTPNMTTEGEQAVTVTYTEGEETATTIYQITVVESQNLPEGIASIKSKATSTTDTEFAVVLTDAVVTYVSGSNAYIEDAEAGILIYKSGHGLAAGDKLNGVVSGKVKLYKNLREITSIDYSEATRTTGADVPVTVLTLAQLNADGAYDKYENMRVKVIDATVSETKQISQGDQTYTLYFKGQSLTGFDLYNIIDVIGYPSKFDDAIQFNVWENAVVKGATKTTITGISDVTVKVGETKAINATASSGAKVSYVSTNPSVATVGEDGTVTGVAEGSTTITVSVPAYNGYPAAAEVCNVTVTADSQGGGDEPEQPAVTVSTTIADYASANGWENAKQYKTVKLDNVVTAAVSGSSNTGKYYTSGNDWRLYANENATLTISAANNNVIKSVKLTFTLKDNGALKYSTTTITSGKTNDYDMSSITFNVASTSGSKGKVFITAIEVVYQEN